MSLAPGTRVGPYEIVSMIGAGGMGEVYRARDTKLNREVAVKVLPDAVASDGDRLARFTREAQSLASLNHPNIAHIHGLEESGGVRALVMELVEGEDLSERLSGGRIPLDEALPIARQIAGALEAAHEHGIIHRDLKPANIKLRPDGTVKVLDFGLAKALASPGSAPSSASTGPTITTPAMTEAGRVLGTPAYVSPEQARGQVVDKRTDIWAFGCVLFEMLSGRCAFAGDTVTDTLVRVLEREPDWMLLPADTPATVRTLLERCLRKDSRRRLHDIADALIELEDHPKSFDSIPAAGAKSIAPGRTLFVWTAGVALIVALGAIALSHLRRVPTDPPELVEFPIAPASSSRFTGWSPEFAISPDGRHIAFVASSKAGAALWVRSLASPEPRALTGTEGARNPFWSPDSRSLGYFGDGKLKTVQVTGGSPVDVCASPGGVSPPPSGTWNKNDVIVFAPPGGPRANAALYQVAAKGGTPTPVTALEPHELAHTWPWFLPDGQHFLYLAFTGETGILRVGSLTSPDAMTLGPSESQGVYAAGHLFFVRGGNLMAQLFDADARQLNGAPKQLSAQAGIDPPYQLGMFSVSTTGRLVYRPMARTPSQLTWLDRGGTPAETIGDPGVFFNLDLSRDGQRLAVSSLNQLPDAKADFAIWVMELATGRATRLTDDPAWEFDPAWSPDGMHIAFSSNRSNPGRGPYGLFMRASDGSGKDLSLREVEAGINVQTPDWSRQDVIVYTNESDLWTLSMSGDRKPTAFLNSKHREASGTFSSDGRWIAYESNESGRTEVHVRPFPKREGVYPISRNGGVAPRWRGDGKELFFLSPERTMMVVRIDTAQGFKAEVPQRLFPTQLGPGHNRPYDVAADGQRFLIPIEVDPPPLRLVMDWRALLPR
jgi:serine/threonine protein kinase